MRVGKSTVSRLTNDDRRFLREHATIKTYRKNFYVFSQGDEGESFFLILTGQVEVYVEYAGSRTLLCRLGPDDFFGELAVLGGAERSASVVTVGDSTFAVLRKDAFYACLSARPTLWLSIVHQLIDMVRALTAKVSLTALDTYSRLRFYLYHLAREVDGQLVIEGYWSQLHLAQLVGCARETVAKIMTELSKGKWIDCQRNRIVLLKTLPDRF